MEKGNEQQAPFDVGPVSMEQFNQGLYSEFTQAGFGDKIAKVRTDIIRRRLSKMIKAPDNSEGSGAYIDTESVEKLLALGKKESADLGPFSTPEELEFTKKALRKLTEAPPGGQS